MYGPASIAMDTFHSNYVRFSVLAVSSIFFLVDPFAAIPAFLASLLAPIANGNSRGTDLPAAS
jgi:hypothetical protein